MPNVNFLHKVHMFNETFKWAPLHAACYYGNSKMIDLLMEAGADVEQKDTWYQGVCHYQKFISLFYQRPLAWAAFAGHFKVCKRLIETYKADIKATNIHGQSALELVSDPNHTMWKEIFSVSF